MATRYGNGGGRGRRITDFEDEPLTDEVEKGWGDRRRARRNERTRNLLGPANYDAILHQMAVNQVARSAEAKGIKVTRPSASVGKAARYYDPEHNRQRRLGAAEAGLAGGGTAAMAYGAHGAVVPTKNVRALARPPGGVVFRSAEEIKTYKAKQKLAGKTIAASPKHIAAVGAGAAAVTGAGLIHHKAKSISADRKHGVWR